MRRIRKYPQVPMRESVSFDMIFPGIISIVSDIVLV